MMCFHPFTIVRRPRLAAAPAVWIVAGAWLMALAAAPGARGEEQLAAGPRAVRVFCWSRPHPACSELIGMDWVQLGGPLNVRDLAERSRRAPPGCAATFLWKGADRLFNHPDDMLRTEDGKPTNIPSPWPAHAIAEIRQRVVEYCAALKAAGGRMDYLALDLESGPLFGSYNQPKWLEALRGDPRGRQLLEHVANPPKTFPPGAFQPPISARPDSDSKFANLTALQVNYVCAALDVAIFEPAREVFPDVQGTNYGAVTSTPKNFILEPDGQPRGWNMTIGNRCSPALYAEMPPQFSGIKLSDPRLMNQPIADDRPYGWSVLNVLRWSLNTVRSIRRSCDLPVDPWLPASSYRSAFYQNRYYDELFYHLALTGCDTLMLFNPRGPEAPANREDEDLLADACVATINRLIGAERRGASTIEPIPWNSELIVTGQEIGDQVLWRITTGTPSRNVRVEPTGEILEMGGNVGRWYVSPRDAKLTFEIAR